MCVLTQNQSLTIVKMVLNSLKDVEELKTDNYVLGLTVMRFIMTLAEGMGKPDCQRFNSYMKIKVEKFTMKAL